MSGPSVIDHILTDEVVCPSCGHKDRDSWEYGESSTSATCPKCETEFGLEVITSVSYTTWLLAAAPGATR